MKISENKSIKNVHHVTKRTHELFKNSKICNYTNALLLILVLSVSILATQMFINNKNKVIPDAEIKFTELSKDKKILGSIMPASCESYPGLGDPHFAGDTMGSCPTSCPADRMPGPVNFKECYYGQYFSFTAEGMILNPISRLVIPVSQGACASTSGQAPFIYEGNIISVNSCVPRPPTVNIRFE